MYGILYLAGSVIAVLAYIEYRPYIDRTSNGSIIIWYNYKGKRIFKYLWKNQEN